VRQRERERQRERQREREIERAYIETDSNSKASKANERLTHTHRWIHTEKHKIQPITRARTQFFLCFSVYIQRCILCFSAGYTRKNTKYKLLARAQIQPITRARTQKNTQTYTQTHTHTRKHNGLEDERNHLNPLPFTTTPRPTPQTLFSCTFAHPHTHTPAIQIQLHPPHLHPRPTSPTPTPTHQHHLQRRHGMRGGGLGSRPIFKKFNEPYAPS